MQFLTVILKELSQLITIGTLHHSIYPPKKLQDINGIEAIGKKCWEIFNSTICRNGCHMEQTMQKGKTNDWKRIGNNYTKEEKKSRSE